MNTPTSKPCKHKWIIMLKRINPTTHEPIKRCERCFLEQSLLIDDKIKE
jgi:hypothetical protein